MVEEGGGMGCGGRREAFLPLPLLLFFFSGFVAKDLALKACQLLGLDWVSKLSGLRSLLLLIIDRFLMSRIAGTRP